MTWTAINVYHGTTYLDTLWRQGHNWGQYHTGHVSTDNWFDPNCCPHGGISHSLTDLAYGFDTRTMQVIPPGPLSGSHAHDFMVAAPSALT